MEFNRTLSSFKLTVSIVSFTRSSSIFFPSLCLILQLVTAQSPKARVIVPGPMFLMIVNLSLDVGVKCVIVPGIRWKENEQNKIRDRR